MKKTAVIILIISLLSVFVFSQETESNEIKPVKIDLNKDLAKGKAMAAAGTALMITSGLTETASLVFSIMNYANPTGTPGSYYLFSYSLFGQNYNCYTNLIGLGLGLGAGAMLGVGLPLMIVGAAKIYKAKKQMKNTETLLDKYIPEINYNFATNEIILGLRIKV